MDKIKIGIIISTLSNCGPVNVVKSLILQRASCDYTIFCLSEIVDDTIYNELIQSGARVLFLNESHFLSKIYSLRKMVKDNPQDIIHSHGLTADFFSVFLDYPKISTIHNRLLEDYRPQFGNGKGVFLYLCHLVILLFFNHLVACSDSVKSVINPKLSKKTSVIRNGVDINKFTKLSVTKKNTLKKYYGLSNASRIFIYCGSLSKRKNVDFLLNHLSLNENDYFLILGSGPLYDKCREITGSDPRYIYTGKVESPTPYYQISDICLSASESEGLPLAILEAVSTGCKVYLSDIPPHREIANIIGDGAVEFFSLNCNVQSFNNFSFEIEIDTDSNARKLSDVNMVLQYEDLYNSLLNIRSAT